MVDSRNMYFDTHAHFDLFESDGTTADVVQRAREAQVSGICVVGSSMGSNGLSVRLAEQYPEWMVAAVGYDRAQVAVPHEMAELEEWAAHPQVAAIGEIGLDYFYEPELAAAQRGLFEKMLGFALDRGLPVIVHCRDAEADMMAMLKEFSTAWKTRWGAGWPQGVLHCFTGSAKLADWLLAESFMISFSGIVSFNNADRLRDIARTVPDEYMLIETDCPYLAPKPYRGRTNEPAYVVRVAEVLAEVRGVDVAYVADCTKRNAERFFRMEERMKA